MSEIKWLSRDFMKLPCVTLCKTEKQFRKAFMSVSNNEVPPWVVGGIGFNAVVHTIPRNQKTKHHVAIVCLDKDRMESCTTIQIYTLLVHEAVHIYQFMRDSMGSVMDNDELAAIAIQTITQNLFEEWNAENKPSD